MILNKWKYVKHTDTQTEEKKLHKILLVSVNSCAYTYAANIHA